MIALCWNENNKNRQKNESLCIESDSLKQKDQS